MTARAKKHIVGWAMAALVWLGGGPAVAQGSYNIVVNMDSQFICYGTPNLYVTAKVFNKSTGSPVPNVQVNFSCDAWTAMTATSAITNSQGMAQISVGHVAPGTLTVTCRAYSGVYVNTGSGSSNGVNPYGEYFSFSAPGAGKTFYCRAYGGDPITANFSWYSGKSSPLGFDAAVWGRPGYGCSWYRDPCAAVASGTYTCSACQFHYTSDEKYYGRLSVGYYTQNGGTNEYPTATGQST